MREIDTLDLGREIENCSWQLRAAAKAGLSISGQLSVPPPRNQGVNPKGTRILESTLYFKFSNANHPQSISEIEHISCEIEVAVRGMLDVRGTLIDLEDHWRIDTHPVTAYKSDPNSKPPREAHPLFHFQRGGQRLDDFANDSGFVPGEAALGATVKLRGSFQHPSPRIPVLPVCPCLAVDMVLSQHQGPAWRRLSNDPDYRIPVESQRIAISNLYVKALLDKIGSRRRQLLYTCD